MGRGSAVRLAAVAASMVVLLVACGGGQSSVRSVVPSPGPAATTSTTSTSSPAAVPSSSLPASPTTSPGGPAVAADGPDEGAVEDAAGSPPPAADTSQVIDRIGGTGGATKVITVVSATWASSTAALTLWERRADGSWARVAGPWEADVGGEGWAYEPGEATRRSPVGSFGFGGGFGLQPDPGYVGGWFVVGDTDYWVEDPASPDYNTHQPGPADPALAPWGHFEHLADYPVAYRYAVLITFNVPARGGIGSGIFLHVSTGGPTAGCVSLPEDELLTTLRWIDPATTRIVMGPESALAEL